MLGAFRKTDGLSAVGLALLAVLVCAQGVAARGEADRGDRPLAMVVLVDNDSGDTCLGDVAEWAGEESVRAILHGGPYRETRYLVGARACREDFLATVRELAQAGFVVDLVMETHGLPGRLAFHDGILSETQIRDGLYLRGGEAIRLVYMMGCHSATLNGTWLAVGADAVTGHRGINTLPVFHLPAFLLQWRRGMDAQEATQKAYRWGRRMGGRRWYQGLLRLFDRGSGASQAPLEESEAVYSGRSLRIGDIPSLEDERAWMEKQRKAEGRRKLLAARLATSLEGITAADVYEVFWTIELTRRKGQ